MHYLLLLFVFLFLAPETHANKLSSNVLQKHIIDTCWALSKKDRDSGITSRMMNGSYKTVNCLHKEIVRLSKPFFNKETDHQKFITELETSIENAYSLNWLLFNGGCYQAPCPTMFRASHISSVAHMLEDILNLLFSQAEFNNKVLK